MQCNTREQRIAKLTELVNKFDNNIDQYKSKEYKEAKLRTDFLNPFFEILDWDISNEAGKSEDYRDVIIEDTLEIGDSKKAPDFCFKIGRERKFYVEAKKPSVDIKNETEPSLQVRRYGYTAGLPLSILTDFEELSIYDTSIKPHKNDKASIARIRFLKYTEFIDNFDYLYDTFSKTSIEKGSFDKFVAGSKNKRGTESIDKGLLAMVEDFRLTLAKNISKLNDIDKDSLNFAVIKIIDRIIFLRIAEDKKVEPYAALLNASKSDNVYKNLKHIFKDADLRYNSELFKNNHSIDDLIIDDKVLKDIIVSLYYPECSYEFSVLPVSILGNIYEQFLGQTIRQTESGMVKIEEKPEVRKAGGVYYTPQYIVNYIVKNTVGEKIKNLTPKEIEKITILDPACGSGSFLIGAYQYLLDYHLEYYTKPDNIKTALKNQLIAQTDEHSYRLTISEKQKILKNNIYGVDIDAQAVEVSKFSLMLKLMETESDKTMQQELLPLSHVEGKKGMKILPDLSNNIKCGNSLIGKDFLADNLMVDNQIIKEVNPFDWNESFAEIMKSGGFDCVIGNPPYLKLTENNTEGIILSYYNSHYVSLSGGSSKNLFQMFIEKVVLLKSGIISFIVPEALLTTSSNGKIREILLQNYSISSLALFDSFVFVDATIGSTIFVTNKKSDLKTNVYKLNDKKEVNYIDTINLSISTDAWEVFLDKKSQTLFNKIEKYSNPMKELSNMSKGMVVKSRDAVLENTNTHNNLPFVLGNCMNRYRLSYKQYADYSKLEIIGGTRDFNKQTKTPRLLIRRTGSILCATYSDNKELIESTLYILTSDKIDLKYLLGLINSKILSYYLAKKLQTNSQGFPQVLMSQLDRLPIPKLENNTIINKIISFVDNMLLIQKQLQSFKIDKDKEILKQKADIIDKQIDKLVYELYGLTEEEIKTVEGN